MLTHTWTPRGIRSDNTSTITLETITGQPVTMPAPAVISGKTITVTVPSEGGYIVRVKTGNTTYSYRIYVNDPSNDTTPVTELPERLSPESLSSTYLSVLVYNGTAYPVRPSSVPGGLIRYLGPVSPSDAVDGDEWVDTSAVDSIPPSAVSNLTAGTATPTTIPLSWTAATDNIGVIGYEYSLDGTTYTATGSTNTTYTVTGLAESTNYTIRVRAFDQADNRSPAVSITKATSSTSVAYKDAVLADAPTWYWQFNEAAGSTTATSIGSSATVLTNVGATFGSAGIGDGATSAEFTGASTGLQTAAQTVLAGFTSISWEAIVTTASGAGTALYQQSTLEWFPVYGGKATAKVSNATIVDNLAAVSTATPMHFAATWDGTTVRWYKNGVETGTTAFANATGASTNGQVMNIGNAMNGKLAGLAVYKNKVLTPSRILAHAQAAGKA